MTRLTLNDYALIGNASSAALISRLGSIDWCCFPYIDSSSHFGALLDDHLGGKFQIMPQGEFRSEQRYLQRTFVLETHFETPHGRATLTDWMPLSEETGSHGETPLIRRRLEVLDGKIAWSLFCTPRFEYGAHPAEGEPNRHGVLFRSTQHGNGTTGLLLSDIPLEISGNDASALAKFTLEAGQKADFAWSWGRIRPSLADSENSRKATANLWRARAHHCQPPATPNQQWHPSSQCIFNGPWHDAIARTSLTLRLLQSPSLGSVAESITTSVPGLPMSSRNWDYRYAWLRDIPGAIRALLQLGHADEARSVFLWLNDILLRDGPASLQSVYRLDGGKDLQERELFSWHGFQDARPVRVGNGSVALFQLDIYGQVLMASAEYYFRFGDLPAPLWDRLAEIADYICQAWRRPDHGLWESRSKAEHYVISKVFCWVALDRACTLMAATHRNVPARWEEEKKILHRTICSQGYDPDRGSFIRSFGDREIDASLLLIPIVGFLPFDDPRIQNTLIRIQEELSDGILLYRYKGADGLPGHEGAHLPSSFNFVTCLAQSGRVDEASDRLAELCTFATPLGFFGEQVDPAKEETSGNFPCASVHLALVQAAASVGLARERLKQKYPPLKIA